MEVEVRDINNLQEGVEVAAVHNHANSSDLLVASGTSQDEYNSESTPVLTSGQGSSDIQIVCTQDPATHPKF